MFQVAKFAALALAASSASALVVPRATHPAGWPTDYLEDYNAYHTRYLALGCQDRHNTAFFNLCCHPLLAKEMLSSRPAQCNPSTASAPEPSGGAEEEEDCDDEEDDDRLATLALAVAPAAPKVPASPPALALEAVAASSKSTATPDPVPDASSQKSASTSSTAAKTYSGGYATYYYQNGVAGACGKVHGDGEMIGAIDGERYGNLGAVSSECGKRVKITNTKNQKTVTITIADACPTCTNANSIDLSQGAFKKIANLEEGIVPITWTYV